MRLLSYSILTFGISLLICSIAYAQGNNPKASEKITNQKLKAMNTDELNRLDAKSLKRDAKDLNLSKTEWKALLKKARKKSINLTTAEKLVELAKDDCTVAATSLGYIRLSTLDKIAWDDNPDFQCIYDVESLEGNKMKRPRNCDVFVALAISGGEPVQICETESGPVELFKETEWDSEKSKFPAHCELQKRAIMTTTVCVR